MWSRTELRSLHDSTELQSLAAETLQHLSANDERARILRDALVRYLSQCCERLEARLQEYEQLKRQTADSIEQLEQYQALQDQLCALRWSLALAEEHALREQQTRCVVADS